MAENIVLMIAAAVPAFYMGKAYARVQLGLLWLRRGWRP